MDVGAIERLGERVRRSGAQEASVSLEVDEHITERAAQLEGDSEAFRARQERELDRGIGIE
jgi:hypothetical protein